APVVPDDRRSRRGREGDHGGMTDAVHVELGARSYDVSIGAFSPDEIADKIAAALDPKTTGVGILIDGQVAERSARARDLVAALHQPRAVVADVGFLETLPARERIAGLAEVVKCGFIADAGLLDLLEQSGPDLTVAQHEEVITRAVRVKADVVSSDETESGR